MNYFFKKENQKAFTLIEMLVAVSIFSVAIVAMMVVVGADLKNINYTKKKLVATYLASEGIELMRSIRDTYGLYDALQIPAIDGWTEFKNKIVSDCNVATSCFIDIEKKDDGTPGYYNIYTDPIMPMTKVLIGPCAILGCPAFYYHASNGEYDYDSTGGTITDFKRSIVVNVISANEVQIISSVSWAQSSGIKTVTFYDNLFNQI